MHQKRTPLAIINFFTSRCLLVQGSDSRKDLALEELERRTAARRDEGHLVLHVELSSRRRRVAAADDALVALGGRLGDRLEHGLGAVREVVELEDAGGAVPDDLEC